MNPSLDISQLRKSGHLEEALSKAREFFAADPNDIYLQRAYGWVIYDLVKQEILLFEQGKSSSSKVTNRLNEWLSDYKKFGAHERPGMLHSLLLIQVLKASKVWANFLEFAQWWDPEYCRPEDKKPYKTDNGKLLPSTEMRLFYAIGREASNPTNNSPKQLLAWAEQQLQAGLAIAPNDQWLHYYKSKQLLDKGKIAEAREWLMPVVRRQQNAAWVWTCLGKTFEPSQADKAIICYFRAVQVAVKPQDVAKTRIALARLLAAVEKFDDATVQVLKALEYRSQNNLSTPQTLMQMASTDWFTSRTTNRACLPKEPDVSDVAYAMVFGDTPDNVIYRLGVIDNQNLEKGLAHVAFSINEGIVLPYRLFKGISDRKLGEIIEVGLVNDNRRAITWSASETITLKGFFRKFSGKLTTRAGQPFGFIITDDNERIFVHPNLLGKSAFPEGASITCRAVMGKDKQGKQGWRALTLNTLEPKQ
jgi:tetratricopeptide (TPR) repeat protein